MDNKVILINGYTNEETLKIMRAIKAVLEDPTEVAFAMGTETNRTWVVNDLLKEVSEEHEYMKNNPPGQHQKG